MTLVERRAPVQGYVAGIPWSLHLEAYDAYCKKYGTQQALIEGGCRGGFSTSELDMFIPGWRDRVSEITALRAELAARDARIEELTLILEGRGKALAAAEQQVAVLREALRANFCPRPANSRPDEFDVGQCVDADECGCMNRVLRADLDGGK